MRLIRTILGVVAVFLTCCGVADAAEYLPLQVNTQWVLRHPSASSPVTIEVAARNGNAYRVRFTHPWGENEWDLEERGNKIYMTGYGQNGQVAPMPGDTVFFSFAGNQGEQWKNAIGTLSISATHVTLNIQGKTYTDCIQIKQTSGKTNFYYSFAPGVGFVQFGEGRDAFLLDQGSSHLPGQAIAEDRLSVTRQRNMYREGNSSQDRNHLWRPAVWHAKTICEHSISELQCQHLQMSNRLHKIF